MAPLRSRFGIVHRLEFYSSEDLLQIVQRSAKILGITMDESGAGEIARTISCPRRLSSVVTSQDRRLV